MPTTAETPTTKDISVLSTSNVETVISPVKPPETTVTPVKKTGEQVVSIIQHNSTNGSNNNNNNNSSKILVPKKSKSKLKGSSTDCDESSPSTNKSKRSQSPVRSLQQQLSNAKLNQSVSSESGK